MWSRENLMRGLEQSLELLRTDYVDVMQLHGASVEESEREGVVDTLNDMRAQGKVRHIATSTSVPNLPTFVEWGVVRSLSDPLFGAEPRARGVDQPSRLGPGSGP